MHRVIVWGTGFVGKAVLKSLLGHPAFSVRNPNRVRALVGSFCNGNLAEFHAADGSGYLVVWADSRSGFATAPDIYGARVGADGKTPPNMSGGRVPEDARPHLELRVRGPNVTPGYWKSGFFQSADSARSSFGGLIREV